MDPGSPLLIAALQRQAALLAPVVQHLHEGVVHPPIAPHEWHGPASQSFASLESHLRSQLVVAHSAASEALHLTRLAIGQAGG